MNPQSSRYYKYIRPALKNKAVKTYGFIVFTLVATTIFGLFAIRPTFRAIVALQKSIEVQQEILDKVNQKIEALSSGKANYDALDPTVKNRLNNLLPYSTNLPPIIQELTATAQANDATISGLQFEPTQLEGNPQKVPSELNTEEINFVVNLQGTYPQLINFINDLNKSNRLYTIKSINFNKTESSPLILSVSGKAYYLKGSN